MVEMTTTAASAEVNGVVRVCGAPVKDWKGSFAGTSVVAFLAQADACLPAGCASGWPVSGVADPVLFPELRVRPVCACGANVRRRGEP